jgi:hypothetical protein
LRDEDAAVSIRDVNSMLGDRSGTAQLEEAPIRILVGERLPKITQRSRPTPAPSCP